MTEYSTPGSEGVEPDKPSVPHGPTPADFVPPGHFRASDGNIYPIHLLPSPPGFYRASDGNYYPDRPHPVSSAPGFAPASFGVQPKPSTWGWGFRRAKEPMWLMTSLVVVMVTGSILLDMPVLAWLWFGLYTNYLAQRRGRIKTWPWFLYGLLLGPFAALHAALLRPTPELRQEQARSKWATGESQGLCHFVDGYASGPCLKRKEHVSRGLKNSPHDWRETARGQF